MRAHTWWAAYTRCPRCALLAPNGLYTPGAPSDPFSAGRFEPEPDWESDKEAQRLCCGGCGYARSIAATERVPADDVSTCPFCATATHHPAAADLARCLTCGLLYWVGSIPSAVRGAMAWPG